MQKQKLNQLKTVPQLINMFNMDFYTVFILTMLILAMSLLAGGNVNINLISFHVDNHTEDKSTRTGNAARITNATEEIRAIE